jgi:hypothetical protein
MFSRSISDFFSLKRESHTKWSVVQIKLPTTRRRDADYLLKFRLIATHTVRFLTHLPI